MAKLEALQKQREELRAKAKAIREEREQIEAESTAARLERNHLAARQAHNELSEVEKEISRFNVGPTQEERDLQKQLTDAIHREQSIILTSGSGVLPDRFIRNDSVEHFTAEKNEAEAAAQKILARRSQTVELGPRLAGELKEHEAIVRDFPRTIRLAEIGQAVFLIRAEREILRKRVEELQRARDPLRV